MILECRRSERDPKFYPLFTVLTKPCTLNGNITLSSELVIGMVTRSMDIQYSHITASHIGPVVEWEGAVFASFINGLLAKYSAGISALLATGYSLEGFLQWAHLDVLKFASFEGMKVTNHDGYVDLEFDPVFNITTLGAHMQSKVDEFGDWLMSWGEGETEDYRLVDDIAASLITPPPPEANNTSTLHTIH